jgi:hypothetical protein
MKQASGLSIVLLGLWMIFVLALNVWFWWPQVQNAVAYWGFPVW